MFVFFGSLHLTTAATATAPCILNGTANTHRVNGQAYE